MNTRRSWARPRPPAGVATLRLFVVGAAIFAAVYCAVQLFVPGPSSASLRALLREQVAARDVACAAAAPTRNRPMSQKKKRRRLRKDGKLPSLVEPEIKDAEVDEDKEKALGFVKMLDEQSRQKWEEGDFMGTVWGQIAQTIIYIGLFLMFLWEIYLNFFFQRKAPMLNPFDGVPQME